MPNQQQEIPLGEASRKAQPWDDYRSVPGLPPGVYPTPMRIMEQRGSLLLIHHLKHGDDLGKAKRRLFTTLCRFDQVDAPGDVTVWAVWGSTLTARRLIVFTRDGEQEDLPLTTEQFKARISEWFNERRRQ